ncbi:hypothetical protein [Agathobaculum desmolans]|uniref:hypothetical protein n=1 Tax=Agathobaculum desmolans TaxID=39484 RepID=UPI00248ECC0A|nr:hypothetical protein [Agathobaculum desmolans]
MLFNKPAIISIHPNMPYSKKTLKLPRCIQTYHKFYLFAADRYACFDYTGLIKKKRCSAMLPCRQTCSNDTPDCHKTCAKWKDFQQQQVLQRQQKKSYLKYYGELCATRIRQLSKLAPVWR